METVLIKKYLLAVVLSKIAFLALFLFLLLILLGVGSVVIDFFAEVHSLSEFIEKTLDILTPDSIAEAIGVMGAILVCIGSVLIFFFYLTLAIKGIFSIIDVMPMVNIKLTASHFGIQSIPAVAIPWVQVDRLYAIQLGQARENKIKVHNYLCIRFKGSADFASFVAILEVEKEAQSYSMASYATTYRKRDVTHINGEDFLTDEDDLLVMMRVPKILPYVKDEAESLKEIQAYYLAIKG
ncbi:hypothetical protein ACUHMQ_00265 [Chitinimonas sp. PSY-7]|uniref:hypothetical protein n=1 Tax=Chitinimonas sp. PSY-7 TaxID=3459088 RepID=UPI00403FFEE5